MKSQKGFTLIEMIVVIAVFLFIVGAALGIFISLVQNQKNVLARQQILNQVSYIEEYMSKALRMAKAENSEGCMTDSEGDHSGFIYLLTRYDSSIPAYQGIKFLNQSDGNSCEEFYLSGGILYAKNSNSNVLPSETALTSAGMHIKSIKFSVNGALNCSSGIYGCGASNSNFQQPRVAILLNVFMPNSNSTSCTTDSNCTVGGQKCDTAVGLCQPVQVFQTTVSQRNLNAK